MITPTEAQLNIINASGNIVVSASAGTGKTFTLVKKIEKEIEEYKGYKKIAAITFTVKATNEMRERLKIDTTGHFIGTNNSFVIEEVIQPFMRDIYGPEFQKQFSPDYNDTFGIKNEGLIRMKNRGVIGAYADVKNSFIFELAYEILQKSKACQLYLKSKYRRIYIDEYQDCDKDMHTFFMGIVEFLHIPLFVVGDNKQAIYSWRGACPQLFEQLKTNPHFIHIRLQDNHRSCKQIQNYSNLLYPETSSLYQHLENLENIYYLQSPTDWERQVLPLLDLSKSIALLRFRHQDANDQAKILQNDITDFVYLPPLPIAEIANHYSWLIHAICKYCVLKNHSVYDFREEIPKQISNLIDNRQLRSQLQTIKKTINDRVSFFQAVNTLANIFNYKISNRNLEKMQESIIDERYQKSYTPELYQHISITLHSAKGLEFDQVIVFTEDFPLETTEQISHHYVAVTRAKEKLIIVNNPTNPKSKRYIQNLSLKFHPIPLEDLVTII